MDFEYFFSASLVLVLLGICFTFILILKKRSRVAVEGLKKREIFTIIALFLVPLLIFLIPYCTIQPKIINSVPETETLWSDYSTPLEVEFNMPVDAHRLIARVTPEIKGDWVWEPFITSRFTKRGKFYPKETLFPEQRVVVYITGIGRFGFTTESHEYGFVFDAPRLPEVKASEPFNGAKDVDPEQEISLFLNKENIGTADWDFHFEPLIDFKVEEISDVLLKLIPIGHLQQNTNYKLSIGRRPQKINLETKALIDQNPSELVHEIYFETVKEPLVEHFVPRGNSVLAESKIKIRFIDSMDQDSVEENFTVTPTVEGDFEWDDPKTFSFYPTNPLPKGTHFTVTFKDAIFTKNGVASTQEIRYEFETIGALRIKSVVPATDEIKVSEKAQIRLTFDQELDMPSAEANLRITPALPGTITWEDNTLVYQPSQDLEFGTRYEIKMLKGVKSLHGLDSVEDFVSAFTTRTNQVIISMPLYYQPQYPPSFSCNIYSAKMALAWKGYNLDASSIISELGYDTRQDALGRWLGNPNDKFIGNADGSWGYGVYWNPIQRLFTNRGLKTELHENWNLKDVARSIEQGKPVMIWRYNGTSVDMNMQWGTSGVYAINGQHGGVITGFRGSASNPTQFYINDPWFGLIWMDTNVLDYYWSRLNRVGMIIY